ncbi:hypothetical protein R1flu_013612 [Riccia fluitans]|uniref:Uncharacterized protein n=1 Tax=Riccia fluitans TaxID=41844 RepID=A0ABD1YE23_9MARC
MNPPRFNVACPFHGVGRSGSSYSKPLALGTVGESFNAIGPVERLQASEQKLQWEEAKNAWLNEVIGTLTSELQTLRSEGTKAKLTRKVPDWDWLHEAKQRWRANPSPKNLFRLIEALEEHEDRIVVREKMFLKHMRYLTVTIGDE